MSLDSRSLTSFPRVVTEEAGCAGGRYLQRAGTPKGKFAQRGQFGKCVKPSIRKRR